LVLSRGRLDARRAPWRDLFFVGLWFLCDSITLAWIMALRLIAEIAAVTLLHLDKEYVEFLLKIDQHLAQLRIGFVCLLERLSEFGELLSLFSGLLPQADEFFAFAV
jgi:hypothetical protein